MELNGEMKQLRADYGKGQKDIFNEIRELKEKLTTQKKKVNVLEESVRFISGDFEKVKNESMKNQIEILKADNIRLSETVAKFEEGGDLCQKVNYLDNFIRRSNVEIQGVPVVNNENLESLVMSTLKVVDPRIQRKDVVSFRRF